MVRTSATPALQRPRRGDGRIIAGVCAGIADRLGVSRLLVRILFVIFGVTGAGELVYVIAWLLMPNAPRRY